jgi:hypothetical protein
MIGYIIVGGISVFLLISNTYITSVFILILVCIGGSIIYIIG